MKSKTPVVQPCLVRRLKVATNRVMFLTLIVPWIVITCGAWLVWVFVTLFMVAFNFLSGAENWDIPDWPDEMLDACERVERRITGLLMLQNAQAHL